MENANFNQLVSFVFGIANDCLVDVYDVGDYRKIILPMIVLRRFDAVLEPTKQAVLAMKQKLDAAGIMEQDVALCSVAHEAFCNSSPFTLSDLKSRTNQQQLKQDFILYLDGFSKNVQDIITKFEFRNQIDTFILDFVNDPGVIKAAFDKYYKTTILSGETDVNKLNDQISEMESLQVYTHEDVDSFVEAYLDNAPREELDPILDRCTENYKELIPEEQILFKSNAKGFVRTYNFLSAILPYGSVEWEKLSIFLKLLIGKLPSPAEDDNISGLLEDIDLESYRAVAQDTMRIQLDNENGELNPIPVSRDVGISVPELDPLTQILKEFHDAFGGIDWTDEDKVKKQVADLPAIVSKDEAYQNAIKNSDAQNARVESDRATMQAILDSMSTTIELYKAVNENPALCKWIQDMVFANTYQTSPPAKEDQPDFD